MGLEAGTFVNDLVITNPPGTDPILQGDDHLRLIKSVLKTTLPNASKAFRFPTALAKTGVFTIVSTDMNKFFPCDTAGGSYAANLPTLAAGDDGWATIIQKTTSDANVVTITPAAGTINGAATLVLDAQHEAAYVIWTGTTWQALNVPNVAALVTGPGSATDNAVARFDGTTGKLVQNSGVTISDANDITVTSTDAGAATAPILILHRDSASPAASDVIGQVRFDGEDGAGNQQEYGSIQATIADTTSTSEDGSLDIYATIAGTRTMFITAGRNAAGTASAAAVGLPLGQLSFPASQNASSDTNTLDDYEEGTWTPGVTINGSAAGITFTTQIGAYTKIGRLVVAQFGFTLSSNGAGTGNAVLTGLPFTVGDSGNGGFAPKFYTGLSGAGCPVLDPQSGTTTANIGYAAATAWTFMTDTNLTNTGSIYGVLTYVIN